MSLNVCMLIMVVQIGFFKGLVSCFSCLLTLQGIQSIPIHAFATFIQINHFCDFKYDYPLWHLVKMTSSLINDYKMVCNCICNLYLQLMLIWMKIKTKIHFYHPFLMASQNRWKCSCFWDLEGGSRAIEHHMASFQLVWTRCIMHPVNPPHPVLRISHSSSLPPIKTPRTPPRPPLHEKSWPS
jgi:hypothetical protein